MNCHRILSFTSLLTLLIIFPNSVSKSQTATVQDNPLLIYHTAKPPIVDGIGNDSCWQNVKWQSMNQVWIPWNGTPNPTSYTGRFKVVWSSATNLLYFLLDIFDDVLVDGYQPSINPGTGYNFDISEVFIDENRSGGEHRYDGPTTNAQNAFTYHMYAAIPADGGVTTTPYIEDMAGTQANSKWVNYSSHFPEYKLRRTGQTCVREFSLIVYNDKYTETNKEAARVKLQVGKVMGLSVAYCDNDHPNRNPKTRDNMYGSVTEPSPGNLHWMNADYFGYAILSSEVGVAVKDNTGDLPTGFRLEQNYPNPFNPSTTISYELSDYNQVSLKVFDLLGREISTLVNESKYPGKYETRFSIQNTQLTSGVYFYQLRIGNYIQTKKMEILK